MPAITNNMMGMLRRLVDDSVLIVSGAGAPTDGTSGTGVDKTGPGSIYVDITNANLYINENTKVSPTWVDFTSLGAVDGLGNLRLARATWDFDVDGGAISAIDLGVTLPDNAIIQGGFYDMITTATSATDAGTGAISVEGANDIVTAVAIGTGTPFDAGQQAIIPKSNTPQTTSVKTTSAQAVTFTIAVEAFTAGKFVLFLYYTISD